MVIAIIAVLATMMLPALLSARAAAYRVQCQSNLKSIGQALLTFEAGKDRLPAGRNERGGADHSWATVILPHLEEQALYDQYSWSHRWNDGSGLMYYQAMEFSKIHVAPADYRSNLKVAATNLSIFLCPATTHDHLGATDYGGNYGSMLTGLQSGLATGNSWESGTLTAVNLIDVDKSRRVGIRMREITDGVSHTFLVLEDAGRKDSQGGMWANGHNCFGHDRGGINRTRSSEIFSDHTGTAHALLADGSVMSLNVSIEPHILGALSTRAGNEEFAMPE